jgi:hypothetical protein
MAGGARPDLLYPQRIHMKAFGHHMGAATDLRKYADFDGIAPICWLYYGTSMTITHNTNIVTIDIATWGRSVWQPAPTSRLPCSMISHKTKAAW